MLYIVKKRILDYDQMMIQCINRNRSSGIFRCRDLCSIKHKLLCIIKKKTLPDIEKSVFASSREDSFGYS